MRRTLIIAGILLLIIGAGLAYFYFFEKPRGIAVVPQGAVNFPTAGQREPTAGGGASTASTQTAAPEAVSSRLTRISGGPVVPGEAVVDIPAKNASPVGDQISNGASSSPSSTSLGVNDVAVSYIERQSGNVYVYVKSAGTVARKTNKTLPGIQSALWVPDGSTAFVRYLSGADFSSVSTYALPVDNGLSADRQGFFLPQNLADIAIASSSPVGNPISNGASILTLASGVNGSVASLGKIDGSRTSDAFTTPLSALRIAFAGKNQYLAFTKPTSSLPGYAFFVDKNGRFSRVAGPANGLVALPSPSGKHVLISYIQDGSMQLALITAATGETTTLPVATIADKCVWTADDSAVYCGIPVSPSAIYQYPDDWYQGAVAFSDRIWKIDVTDRFAQLVFDFSLETESALDAQAMAINPLGTMLVFVNKNDGSLWAYSL